MRSNDDRSLSSTFLLQIRMSPCTHWFENVSCSRSVCLNRMYTFICRQNWRKRNRYSLLDDNCRFRPGLCRKPCHNRSIPLSFSSKSEIIRLIYLRDLGRQTIRGRPAFWLLAYGTILYERPFSVVCRLRTTLTTSAVRPPTRPSRGATWTVNKCRPSLQKSKLYSRHLYRTPLSVV